VRFEEFLDSWSGRRRILEVIEAEFQERILPYQPLGFFDQFGWIAPDYRDTHFWEPQSRKSSRIVIDS
jgi:hypothetical protein